MLILAKQTKLSSLNCCSKSCSGNNCVWSKVSVDRNFHEKFFTAKAKRILSESNPGGFKTSKPIWDVQRCTRDVAPQKWSYCVYWVKCKSFYPAYFPSRASLSLPLPLLDWPATSKQSTPKPLLRLLLPCDYDWPLDWPPNTRRRPFLLFFMATEIWLK